MNKVKIFILIAVFILSLFSYSARADEILAWQDCLKEAAQNNPDLISSQENISQSEASKRITASGLFPQINSGVNATRSKNSGTTTNNFSYDVSADQLLFDGFKTTTNVKAAAENLKAAQHQYHFVSSQIRFSLRSAFVNLLQAQEMIQVAEDIAKIRKSNLVLITLSYESGLEHKGALLTAEANLAEAEFEKAQAHRNLEVAERQLTREMGRSQFMPISVKGDFSINDHNLEKPDFEVLAKNNPHLQQLIAQENAAALGIKSAYANFFPEISAQTGAGRTDSRWAPRNGQWNAGLALTFPLFEGGLRVAQVDQAQAVFRQAQANKRSVRDSIIVALEETWAALKDAVDMVGVQRKTLIATEERSKIAQAQYSTGFMSYDNWTIIEDNLVQSKKAYLNAQANALSAEANWIQAKGETLEYAE
ncbi:MAG: TolC family protein [Candidatus Omnitrophica bacterium]|nr:TolC family protein [Candidatus Omnitrophota bacterium]